MSTNKTPPFKGPKPTTSSINEAFLAGLHPTAKSEGVPDGPIAWEVVSDNGIFVEIKFTSMPTQLRARSKSNCCEPPSPCFMFNGVYLYSVNEPAYNIGAGCKLWLPGKEVQRDRTQLKMHVDHYYKIAEAVEMYNKINSIDQPSSKPAEFIQVRFNVDTNTVKETEVMKYEVLGIIKALRQAAHNALDNLLENHGVGRVEVPCLNIVEIEKRIQKYENTLAALRLVTDVEITLDELGTFGITLAELIYEDVKEANMPKKNICICR